MVIILTPAQIQEVSILFLKSESCIEKNIIQCGDICYILSDFMWQIFSIATEKYEL